MIRAGRTISISKEGRATTAVVTVVTAIWLCGAPASAQIRESAAASVPVASAWDEGRVSRPAQRSVAPIHDAIASVDYSRVQRQRAGAAEVQAGAARRERSVGRKVLGAALGATGGFFAGGYLGAAIEGDRCHCDDPGLKGALIGAPIGAVTGGILGAMFF